MATLQDVTSRTVKEGEDLDLQLTLEEDRSGETLVLYLTSPFGDVNEVGSAQGVGAGEDMVVDGTADVPPGSYYVEVGPQDKSLPAIWPTGDKEARLKVKNTNYNDGN